MTGKTTQNVLLNQLEDFFIDQSLFFKFDYHLLKDSGNFSAYSVHTFSRLLFTLAGTQACKFIRYDFTEIEFLEFIQMNPFPGFGFFERRKFSLSFYER